MKSVLIVGSPGAGKSTLAKALAARTGLPLTHLNEMYWDSNGQQVERELWLSRLEEALAGERWILDGNFSSTLLRRAYQADTVIFLNPPRLLCWWRAFWRERLGHHPHGQFQAHWPSPLLRDIWDFPPQAEWQLAQLRTVPGLRLTVLTGDAEVRDFLKDIQ